jgi:cytidyltransferase-like protein
MSKVMTLMCADMFHLGHLNLIERAKMLGDVLIVGIPTNWTIKEHTKGNDMVMSAEERLRIVQACRYVDFAFVYADVESAEKSIELLKPDLYVRGDDWQDFPCKAKIEELKIPIKFLPYTKDVSSTKRRKCIKQ